MLSTLVHWQRISPKVSKLLHGSSGTCHRFKKRGVLGDGAEEENNHCRGLYLFWRLQLLQCGSWLEKKHKCGKLLKHKHVGTFRFCLYSVYR
jgi:hypothetical protein